MYKIIKKTLLMLCGISIIAGIIPVGIAETNVTGSQTTTLTTTPATTPDAAANSTEQGKFRVGPTVRLRPLNSNIEKDKDGIVEIFLNNPSLNDISLEVDMSVSVPSGIYIYGEDGGMSGGAGTVVGHFSVLPGSSRTITLHIKGTEIGDFPVHFGGMYWPEGDKDKWNPISLDHRFKVNAISSTPTPTPVTPPETKKTVPGFGAILAIFSVFGIARMIARKN